MKLRVQYTAQLRTAAGRPEEEVEIPEGTTLAALLTHLAGQLKDGAATHLLTPDGQVRPSLLTVVNGAVTAADSARTTVLQAGDVVLLMPPIAGG